MLQGIKSTNKSVAYLYSNHETSEKDIKRTIQFTIASKPIIYLEINVTKEVKDKCHKTTRLC